MDGFGHLDLGRCQPSQNVEQDLSSTQLARWLSASAFADAPSTIYSRTTGVRSDCPKSGRDYQAGRRSGKANSQVTKSHKSLKAI